MVFEIWFAEKCAKDEKHPFGYTGYLLMEYFPLGNISSNLHELNVLDLYNKEIKEIENKMKTLKNDEEFGKCRIKWQTATGKRDKLIDCCKRLLFDIIESLKLFHAQNLVHLDIKGIYYVCWF